MTKRIDPKKKSKTGPKGNWKQSKEKIRKLEEAFAIDATIAEACFYADISHDTYHRWMKEDPELSDKLQRLRQKPILKARKTISESLQDPKVAAWYLERKKKDEFSPRIETENTHKLEHIENIEKKLRGVGSKSIEGADQLVEGNGEDAVQG